MAVNSGRDSWKELLSFECNVTGIKFYNGYKRLHSLMSVKLVRKKYNAYDANAIMVIAGGRQLGYVERCVAVYLAPVMDRYDGALMFIG